MLNFDFQNLQKIKSGQNTVTKSEILYFENKFKEYHQKLLSRNQGFLDLPNQNLNSLKSLPKLGTNTFKHILVLGIGGSMLGPQTILDTLYFSPKKNQPKVYCLDNVDPFRISEVLSEIDLSKTLCLVQTKSGGTPETLAQYFVVKEQMENMKLNLAEHFIFVTDPIKGYLRKEGEKLNIHCFEIPENVGGRFSVLSSVGLVLSTLINLDTEALLKGAESVKSTDWLTEAYRLAVIQYLLYKRGKNITVLMPYTSRLKTFSAWFVQLLSESIGKEKNLHGETVNVGVTPIQALGATDQHSQLQLFKEGPNDKLLIFLEIINHQSGLTISINPKNPEFDYLNGKTFAELINAELKATKQSLTESGRPNVSVQIQELNEFSLGQLFMFFEVYVAFLGELLEINTFDQPGVERSKILTRELLS